MFPTFFIFTSRTVSTISAQIFLYSLFSAALAFGPGFSRPNFHSLVDNVPSHLTLLLESLVNDCFVGGVHSRVVEHFEGLFPGFHRIVCIEHTRCGTRGGIGLPERKGTDDGRDGGAVDVQPRGTVRLALL